VNNGEDVATEREERDVKDKGEKQRCENKDVKKKVGKNRDVKNKSSRESDCFCFGGEIGVAGQPHDVVFLKERRNKNRPGVVMW
jgi:hypothetical protein